MATEKTIALVQATSTFRSRKDPNKSSVNQIDLLELLGYTGDSLATDPRDHIYGLLSLFPSSLSIEVNYEASVLQVYEDTTLGIMQWSKSLALLRVLEDRVPVANVPSWVPMFDHFASVRGLEQSTSPVITCVVERKRQGELTVNAHFADTVAAMADACPLTIASDWYIDQNGESVRHVIYQWWEFAKSKKMYAHFRPSTAWPFGVLG